MGKPGGVSRRTAIAGMAAAAASVPSGWAIAQLAPPEKPSVRLGFIALTDMAPLAVAQELGFFKDEGLDVVLEKQPSWPALMTKVRGGELDGGQLLGGQPLAAWSGSELIDQGGDRIVAAMSMDLNGNAITVSNDLWALMAPPRDVNNRPLHPIAATALRPAVDAYRRAGNPMIFGVVDNVSNQNFELRYWLAAGGVHPGFYSAEPRELFRPPGSVAAEIELFVAPPPLMPVSLKAALLDGFCVGEPWNQQAVADGTGVPVITDHQIWAYNPEKLFGFAETFQRTHPVTAKSVVKAVIRACKWLDDGGMARRREVVQLLRRPEFVGASPRVLEASLTGTFEFERGDRREAPYFNVFFRQFATYPFFSDAVWFLTQMRRWGQIPEAMPDRWYDELARRVYRPDIYWGAAQELIDAGQISAEEVPARGVTYRPPTSAFIDGVEFDGRRPNAYLDSLEIGLKSGQIIREGRVVDA